MKPGRRPWSSASNREKVAVDLSYAGMLRALQGEQECLRPLKLEVHEVTSCEGDLFIIKLKSGSASKIKEEHENWRAAGPRMPGKSYPWIGEALTVDLDHATLVIHQIGGDSSPEHHRELWLYEPDYQASVREWAKEKARAGHPFPALYREIMEGKISTDRVRVSLSSKIRKDPTLRHAQRNAVLSVGRKQSITWGPPGTGKTYTLGASAAALSLAGRKVLVLAPTNSATDQAALSIDEARNRLGKPLKRGELIRPGRPQSPELEQRSHLMAWTDGLEMFSRMIQNLRRQIGDSQRKLTGLRGRERENVLHKIGKLKDLLRKHEQARAARLWRLAQEADIIVTTLTSGLHHPEILKAMGDGKAALLLDEASMIPRFVMLPFLDIALQHLAIFGDLRQLGPIRRNNNPGDENSIYWVGQNAFEVIGAVEDPDLNRLEKAKILTMLTEQSRMCPELCEAVSRTFYRGRLTTVGSPRKPPLAQGWPTKGLAIVNPHETRLPTFAPGDRIAPKPDRSSNSCERSAWIAVDLALSLLRKSPDRRVLLISPFRDQADLLRKLVQAYLSSYSHVRAGTVHVCQGQEADLVIFDPVDPLHSWLMGRFGKKEMERVLCVAFSRARTHLVVLGKHEEIQGSPLLGELCLNAAEWTPGF